jgi:hypothetical protein
MSLVRGNPTVIVKANIRNKTLNMDENQFYFINVLKMLVCELFYMVAYFCPLHGKINYVNMQENYVNMQENYVNMQVTNV